MIRIAAVDDEMHVLERFSRMVSANKEIELCGLFTSGEHFLSYLKENPLDAVFLDIEMPGVNGLQLSAEILELNESIQIVFVTAFNQYAVEAFELQALDYIMKPMTAERLEKAVRRLMKNPKLANPNEKPFVHCFGDFEVFLDGEALSWKNSKAKEVFAFLVHKNGVSVNWEKIADAVWPDFDAEKAQTNFHATTYLLRKKLSEHGISKILASGRGSYRLSTNQIGCDLYQLEEMIKGNQLNRKEDKRLLEKLIQKGYMEASGYTWAQPKAAELEKICRELLNVMKKENNRK